MSTDDYCDHGQPPGAYCRLCADPPKLTASERLLCAEEVLSFMKGPSTAMAAAIIHANSPEEMLKYWKGVLEERNRYRDALEKIARSRHGILLDAHGYPDCVDQIAKQALSK